MYSRWLESAGGKERKGRTAGLRLFVISALLMPSAFSIAYVPSTDSQTAKKSAPLPQDAMTLLQQGQGDAAIAEYRRAIATAPRNGRNYYGLAVALDRAGALRDERVTLEHALRLDGSYAPVHNQLGLLNRKEAKQALAVGRIQACDRPGPTIRRGQEQSGCAAAYARREPQGRGAVS